MKKVVLDPGHGVETAGKRSPDGQYLEHEFALDIAKKIGAILKARGVEVTYTRVDQHDVKLSERVAIANKIKDLDLFVSIHSNAAGDGSEWKNARGYGIYTSSPGNDAQRNIAAEHLLWRARQAGFHLWSDGLHHMAYYVLKWTKAPAVLIEHFFHDNKEDVSMLEDPEFREIIAQTDAYGILDYLGIKPEYTYDNVSEYAKDSWMKATVKMLLENRDPQGVVTREMLAVVLDRLNLL